ncbi:MAG: flagellar biosynthetic protein FliR, partial [Chloroflexota bacterium]
ALFNQLALLTAGMFAAGIRLALPIITALLLSDISLGLMARSFQQLNIFIVGLPVKLGLAFLLLIITMPAYHLVMQGFLEQGFVDLSNLLRMS